MNASRGAVYELHTIAFSHFCEKARLALRLVGVPFVDRKNLPMFHISPVKKVQEEFKTRGTRDAASSPASTPCLAIYDRETRTPVKLLTDSSHILQYVSEMRVARGLPSLCTPEATELEQRFGAHLGPKVRILVYYHLVRNPHILAQLFWRNGSWLQAILASTILLPLFATAFYFVFKLNKAHYERALRTVTEEVDYVNQQLEKHSYICGNEMTAADLTFAALLAPLIGITQEEGYAAWVPGRLQMPQQLRTVAEKLSSTRAGQLAHRVYREVHQK